MLNTSTRILFTSFGLLCASPAMAQYSLPPLTSSSSPDGVNYRNGSFSYGDTDLSIGGDGVEGLSLRRSYISSIDVPSDLFWGGTGWTHSLQGYVSSAKDPIDPDAPPLPGREPYTYSVTVGTRSATFAGGSQYRAFPLPKTVTGGPVGTYWSLSDPNTTLVFNGTDNTGYYTFTDSDGTIVNFRPGPGGFVSNMTMPDGTRWDWTYGTDSRLKSIISNRGWALLFNGNTACAVNMAQIYTTATSTCPAGVQTVTYGYTPGTYNPGYPLLTSVTTGGQTTTYTYTGADHLGCIKRPGQVTCDIQNTYLACPNDPANPSTIQPKVRQKDPVISQVDAAGRTIAYAYADNFAEGPNNNFLVCTASHPDVTYWSSLDSRTIVTTNAASSKSIVSGPGGGDVTLTDELGRSSHVTLGTNNIVANVDFPEGNRTLLVYDLQNNPLGYWMKAKPGSGLADQATTAGFPATCSNVKTCTKPDYVIDPKGNRTDFTYDGNNGGVLTATGPADANGVRPVKRSAYVQRYAWIKNSGGGYVQAATPVWLRSTEKTCRTSATVGDACSAGSADEVVTTYDYGPESGPNNLLLRGTVVTADGVSLRTCFGYDAQGNQISKTSPRAGLTVCS